MRIYFWLIFSKFVALNKYRCKTLSFGAIANYSRFFVHRELAYPIPLPVKASAPFPLHKHLLKVGCAKSSFRDDLYCPL